MTISKKPGEQPTPIEERLVSDLAAQAGLVLSNARLIEDLRASRQRLVAAQDEERRKIERNLHDGAQQQLVALAVKQRLAEGLIERDPQRARSVLTEAQADTVDALETLRDLARGIYPPVLADRGLAAALQAQVRRATIPVQVHADGIERYEQEIEAAAYFCCLEALQNVTKYAAATAAEVRLGATDGRLTFIVSDDGTGSTRPRSPAAPDCRGWPTASRRSAGSWRSDPGRAMGRPSPGGSRSSDRPIIVGSTRHWSCSADLASAQRVLGALPERGHLRT